MIEQHYRTTELAELLSCNPETILRAAQSGKLRSVRIGRDRRYAESDVVAWLEAQNPGQVVSIDRRRRGKIAAPTRKEAAQ